LRKWNELYDKSLSKKEGHGIVAKEKAHDGDDAEEEGDEG
jgi:hypothetical protein